MMNVGPGSGPGQVRIGELLIKAGFVTKDDLNEALEIAKASGQMVGRVLTMSGFLSESRLGAALRAQEHLRQGSISLDVAIQAMRLADRAGAPFDDALNKVSHSA